MMLKEIIPKQENFSILINKDNIETYKLVWKYLLTYIDNAFKYDMIELKSKIKDIIINILWENIYCEFNNISENTKFSIEITGVQCYSNNEYILEGLVDNNIHYTMCFGNLKIDNNIEINYKKFENWYQKNKVININNL
jgi:hypothetical protein